MKLECPYCWQHYEIEKSDLDRELECINCEQTFRVRDALVVENQSASRRIIFWVVGIMGTLIALLVCVNIWCWVRFASQAQLPQKAVKTAAAETAASQPHQSADLQTVIAPLYRTLKEFRTENDRLHKNQKQLMLDLQQISLRLENLEKQQKSSAGNARLGAMEEGINTLSIKLEGQVASQKLVEENYKQMFKEIHDLRGELNMLNPSDRLTALERNAEKFDLSAVNRRIDKLEALINAIRSVH